MVQRKQRRWNLLALLALLLSLALVLFSLGQIELQGVQSRDVLRLASTPRALTTARDLGPMAGAGLVRGERLTPAEAQADQADFERAKYHVYVGVYNTNNHSLDLRVPSFAGSGYVWMNWDGEMQRYLEAQDTTINRIVVPANLLHADAGSALQPVAEKPLRLPDGRYYQLFTYQGSFYVDHVDYRRFPFMRISLPLALEVNDVEGALDYGNLRLVPELKDSGMGIYANITGLLIQGWSIAEYRHHYATNFGLGGAEDDYSQVVFDVAYGASAWSSFWRLLLPLAVVMAMVLLVSKLRNDLQDVRSTLPVTILLTLVFLQQSYRSTLPDLPYLSFLDQVYVVAYMLTLIAFVLVIWIGRRYSELESAASLMDEQLASAQRQRLSRIDDVWPVLVVLLGSASIAICWLMIPAG